MAESALLKELLIAVSKTGARVFRNNVGQGWIGKSISYKRAQPVMLQPGDVVIKNARPLHSGLCVGSSDLIGWRSVLITPEHIGQRLAVFVAIEAKYGKTRVTLEQENFIHKVRVSGGVGVIARCIEDATTVLGEMG